MHTHLVAVTKTLTHEREAVERSTISFPAGLWKRTRKMALDLGIPANQIVVEALNYRVNHLEKKQEAKRAA